MQQTDNNKVLLQGQRDYMPSADDSWTVAKIVVDLRPSADGSPVRTSLVVEGG